MQEIELLIQDSDCGKLVREFDQEGKRVIVADNSRPMALAAGILGEQHAVWRKQPRGAIAGFNFPLTREHYK